jgi:hypothetical protein
LPYFNAGEPGNPSYLGRVGPRFLDIIHAAFADRLRTAEGGKS